SNFVPTRHRSTRPFSCSTSGAHWRGTTGSFAHTPHSTPLRRMADCAAREHTSLSQGDRVCCQDSQFSTRRTDAPGDCLYLRPLGLERPGCTWCRDLVCIDGRSVEPHSSRLLVCVCKPTRVSVHSFTLVYEAFDLVSASMAGQPHRTEPCADPS